MFKEIYRKKDGKPILIESKFDEDKNKEFFDYDEDDFTEEQPSSKLFYPIHYSDDDEGWKGTDYEEWLESLKDDEDDSNDEEVDFDVSFLEIESSKTQKEVFKMQSEIEKLRNENSKITKELVKLKGDNDDE